VIAKLEANDDAKATIEWMKKVLPQGYAIVRY